MSRSGVRPPPLSDAGAVALAASACAGACVAEVLQRTLPLAAGLSLVALALLSRRGTALVLSVFVLSMTCADRAWSGVDAPDSARYSGPATLVTDPSSAQSGSKPTGAARAVRAVVRVEGRRLDVWAAGSAARRLAPRQAGEIVWVEGQVRAPVPRRARWLALRHVEGTMSVERIIDWSPGTELAQSANRLRSVLVTGARVLEPTDRSIYLGLVIGDDRAQPGGVVDDFRASGLGHLNAVSGQNVAFVLAAVLPLLRRCRPLPRWALTMAFLGWFAVLTRLEPSVLRATFMAALGATAFALGRSAPPLRLLSLTVTALVLVDPFLVYSVGFWMSVTATLGIVLWSGPVAAALRGPRWVVLPLSVSLAAQVGVAPVAWWVFGREAALALPMNLLAGPCAAVVMTLGLPAGTVAGMFPALSAVLHGPTVVFVRLLRTIARLGAAGDVTPLRPFATLLGFAVVGWALQRRHTRLPERPTARASGRGAHGWGPHGQSRRPVRRPTRG